MMLFGVCFVLYFNFDKQPNNSGRVFQLKTQKNQLLRTNLLSSFQEKAKTVNEHIIDGPEVILSVALYHPVKVMTSILKIISEIILYLCIIFFPLILIQLRKVQEFLVLGRQVGQDVLTQFALFLYCLAFKLLLFLRFFHTPEFYNTLYSLVHLCIKYGSCCGMCMSFVHFPNHDKETRKYL